MTSDQVRLKLVRTGRARMSHDENNVDEDEESKDEYSEDDNQY